MTSSARARRDGGIVSPRALAVLRLITSLPTGCGWVASHAAFCHDLQRGGPQVFDTWRRRIELLISGSKVRVLDGPPIDSATSGASGVADGAFATIRLV